MDKNQMSLACVMPYYGWFGVSTFECDLSTLLLAVCIGGVRTSVCVCSVYYIY